jgi:hypothetical protein
MAPISRRFVAALESFAARQGLTFVKFCKDEGVVLIGKAQEKTSLFRTERPRSPKTGQPYPWIVRSTAMVKHYYI